MRFHVALTRSPRGSSRFPGAQEQEEMPQKKMPLEDLGLLQALEKINENTGTAIDRFARYGLVQGGLITDGEPPRLTELGAARLDELRRARDEGAGEAQLVPNPDPDPTPA